MNHETTDRQRGKKTSDKLSNQVNCGISIGIVRAVTHIYRHYLCTVDKAIQVPVNTTAVISPIGANTASNGNY